MTDQTQEPAKTENVEIPPHVFVRCPLIKFRLRQVAGHCPKCEHCRGLSVHLSSKTNIPFEQKFALRCAHPMDRELYHVEIEKG